MLRTEQSEPAMGSRNAQRQAMSAAGSHTTARRQGVGFMLSPTSVANVLLAQLPRDRIADWHAASGGPSPSEPLEGASKSGGGGSKGWDRRRRRGRRREQRRDVSARLGGGYGVTPECGS